MCAFFAVPSVARPDCEVLRSANYKGITGNSVIPLLVLLTTLLNEMITKRQYDQVEKYIQKIQPILNLNHWNIHLNRKNYATLGHAQINMVEGSRNSIISLKEDLFIERDDEQIRNTIVHELIHMIVEPQWQVIQHDMYSSFEYAIGKQMLNALYQTFQRSSEYMIHDLVNILVKFLPEFKR